MQQGVQTTFGQPGFRGELACCLTGAGAGLDLDLKALLQLRVVRFRIDSNRSPAQNHGAFALWSGLTEVFQCSSHAGAHLLFMAFGQLPGHLQRPLRTAVLFKFFQQGEQSMGCFVDHAGA